MADTDLAVLLAEHIGITFNDGSVFCSGCKQLLFEPGMYVTVLGGHSIGESVAVAHVAEVIAAAGWRKCREEWGVHYLDSGEPRGWYLEQFDNEAEARKAFDDPNQPFPCAVVRRYVTDWEEDK